MSGVLPPPVGSHGNEKQAFDCPACGIRLMVPKNLGTISGACPSCGGWIRSPGSLVAMPVDSFKSESAPPMKIPAAQRTKAGRMKTPGGRAMMAGARGVSPEVIRDFSHEEQKEMKGFYRFLGASGLVVGLCLLLVFWLGRS